MPIFGRRCSFVGFEGMRSEERMKCLMGNGNEHLISFSGWSGDQGEKW